MKCDDFTRNWYATRGVDVGEEVISRSTTTAPTEPDTAARGVHRFDEDTIQSCLYLVHKPKKDYAKRLANEGHVLKFKCKMVTSNPVDAERVFVLNFYLEDDTIMIFEQMIPTLASWAENSKP